MCLTNSKFQCQSRQETRMWNEHLQEISNGNVGTSHMSDIRQMSVAMQRLVDLISMVTNSTLLRNNTGANSTLLCNNGKKLRYLLGLP
jgi:hypothetical protein